MTTAEQAQSKTAAGRKKEQVIETVYNKRYSRANLLLLQNKSKKFICLETISHNFLNE